MKTYYVKGKGFHKDRGCEERFELTFDVEDVNAKSFKDAYNEVLDNRNMWLLETEYIFVLN